jgi:transposase
MSLQPLVDYLVPDSTARVAKAAFPKGTLCLQIYDQLGTLFQDQDFATLFPRRGQPAQSPFRLALVTVLQFMEGLSDRAAADAVRSRIDWKYLLCLELEDAGFDFSVLSEFRQRLIAGGAEQRLLEQLLEALRARQLVKARGRARTDSTHVLAAIREVNRLERVIETLRAVLNALATVVPAWVQAIIPVEWVERYGRRAEDYRLPQDGAKRTAYAEAVGNDGYQLLDALWADSAPPWLGKIPAVEILRQVWVQNFIPTDDGARWREPKDLPPGARYLNSPYETEARYSKKRNQTWLGYKVHLTETCDEELPHLITAVHTEAATTGDNDALPAIHEALGTATLLPSLHLVDSGYVEAKRLVESRITYGIDLIGPTPGNHRWQFQQGVGFDLASFHIDWEAKQAQCPAGKISVNSRAEIDHRGNDVVKFVFAKSDCSVCPSLTLCTTAVDKRRSITVRAQPLHEALQAARDREQTAEFKQQYQQRAGIEGTISQGVRGFGLRRTRYRGPVKTHLQHIATAVAINLVRLGAWFDGVAPGKTRVSAFRRVMAPAMA